METLSFVALFLLSAVLVDSTQPPSLQEVLHRLETVEVKLKDRERENVIQKAIIAEQSNAIKRLENEAERRNAANMSHPGRNQRQVGGSVSFTVYLDHDMDLGALQTITFNKIITNEGNGYNVHTGVFTCPEDGVYFFTFSIGQRSESNGIRKLYAELVVNSLTVIDAVAETKHSTDDDQGSNSVVKRLRQGDDVWVRSKNDGHHVEGGSFRITSFTGMYMHT